MMLGSNRPDGLARPERRCIACDASEPIGPSEPIWPLGWQCAACGHVVADSNGIPIFTPDLAGTNSGFDPKLFDRLSKVEATFFWFVARNELIVGLANKFFPEARRFLEIGCGNGTVLGAMARSRQWERLVGSELQPAGLAHARQRLASDVEFVQMDARSIPCTGLFDLVGAFDVIEHIADDEGTLRGLHAAMQIGGGIILSVPQHPWLWSRADEVSHHQRRYRRGELEEKLLRNGFEVLFSSSFNALLFPLMVASRLMGERKGQADEIFYGFTLNRHVNDVFTSLLRAEIRMTLAGFSWPIGGSRIVVARRF
ncbi:class I SAM-dependent methyltransferase [Bradyrhizobium diazoefficiens]|jgi:SAM-dependent methyltransferase|nr:class I SAM-dependent methyltransferase [Bradyrhizobium diazoefficiens]MBR0965830.1 class I SAM-dependent methyltransferase [Bradyrhizobium diazoefficiens]MBR0975873.1 class I SAM-dependent methyltransferase [Bradyrhizobium diazoefficiens]MBR1008837.1 class I SAM-dependent methyltransferase [Bradyrhizobium diazoefficiens]MBR1015107.1 class I SAM-dependent methyltransferase [Bradyrhizobium diazoefficiens]MBR1052780.1 class I SAM-dependent methyltransferase [Bradyrhizobium diazoefficiens]